MVGQGNMVLTFTDMEDQDHSFVVKTVWASPLGLKWTDHEGHITERPLLVTKRFQVEEVQG